MLDEPNIQDLAATHPDGVTSEPTLSSAHGPDCLPKPNARVLSAARRAIARQSFCTLATSSCRNRPHVVGVLYVAVDGILYVHTLAGSTKVRNIRANPHVGVCIPVRKYPLAPPFCVQFQGTAEVRALDDREIVRLLAAGRLKRISGHGALAVAGACFIRITPGRSLRTFGIGVSLLTLLRDPFHANRSTPTAAEGA